MKKTYLKPSVNMEGAQPTVPLCESIQSNVDLTIGDGSNGEARAKEWDIWGEDE